METNGTGEESTLDLGEIPSDEIHFIAHGTLNKCYIMVRTRLNSGRTETISHKVLFRIVEKIKDGDSISALKNIFQKAREEAGKLGITDPVFLNRLKGN